MQSVMCGCCTDGDGNPVEAVDTAGAIDRMTITSFPSSASKGGSGTPRRDSEFQVVLTKYDQSPIGLDISTVGGTCLKVWKVKDGLIQSWNKMQSDKEMQVKAGDGLVQVNGVRGRADEMLLEISKARELDVVFSRGMFSES
mmetsp:Transcript_59850/g.106409  ORF Transcript_59850/g.106409 Transcript_59850/m.106409 type:complete len:142 (+) Transcript_59850:61-486(+)